MLSQDMIQSWALPLLFVVCGILLGMIFGKVILRSLKKLAHLNQWRVDDVIFNSLGRSTVLWFFLAGLYGAVITSPIKTAISAVLLKVVVLVLILSVTVLAARVAGGMIFLYSQKREGILPSTSIFANLAKALVFVLGGLIILQFLGISIAPILTALGVGGLAVALALQDTLSNLFSGLQIIASGQVKKGDYVQLESGERGYVVDINWRNTAIRALGNNLTIIPNAKIAASIVTNFFLPEKELAVLVQVGVAYGSDLEKVETVTIEVARETMAEVPGGIKDFEPFIRYHSLGDFSINFSVIMRAGEFVDQYLLTHEFIKRLHRRYGEEGIVIPFPVRTLHMKRE